MKPLHLGTVIVNFNSADVILDCLESLLAAQGVVLHIVVVDNASDSDDLVAIRQWASGKVPYCVPDDLPFGLRPCAKPISLSGVPVAEQGHRVTLIEAGRNGGFAAGVNAGLEYLARQPELDRFWILNPDSAVPPQTPQAFAKEPVPEGGFSLMGGRVLYFETPDIIQIDGGTINRRTGVTGNIGLGKPHATTPRPNADEIDFITGASMVASRAFYEIVGPMTEDYFLYYEEVDWALKRGTLPLAYCPDGIIYHRAGTSIGSPTLGRPASAFSQYFKHRGRIKFVRKYFAGNLLFAYMYSLAKSAQMLIKGYRPEAYSVLSGSFNRPPPVDVRARLSDEAAKTAFDR